MLLKTKLFGEDTAANVWGKHLNENYVKKVLFPYYCFFVFGSVRQIAYINDFNKVSKGLSCFEISFWSSVLIFLLYLSAFLISHISFFKNINVCICINKLLFLQISFTYKSKSFIYSCNYHDILQHSYQRFGCMLLFFFLLL